MSMSERMSRLSNRVYDRMRDRRAIPLLNTSFDERTYSAGLMGFIIAFVPRGRRPERGR